MADYQPWVFALLIVVMGWFGAGILTNIRRGNAVLKWMQAGLPRVGEKTTLRWLGSSVVEMGIAKAKSPFRRVDLVLVLEPRDVPWFWLMARAQGRRDLLILRGQLHAAPRWEYDVVAPSSWTGRTAMGRAERERWETSDLDGMRVLAPRASAPLSRAAAPAILGLARAVHPDVCRLAVRREAPHLELHVPLPDHRRADASRFFEALRTLARSLAEQEAGGSGQ